MFNISSNCFESKSIIVCAPVIELSLFCFASAFFHCDRLKCKFYLHYSGCCLLQWHHIVKSSFLNFQRSNLFFELSIVLFVLDSVISPTVLFHWRLIELSLFCFASAFFHCDCLKCKFYLHYSGCCLLQWRRIVKSSFFKLSTV